MYRPLIEFCLNNLASDSEKLKEQLENDENLDVIEYDCLGHCEFCAMNLFCLVDGEIVAGESEEELKANIYRYLNDHQVD